MDNREAREAMVREQIAGRGITDSRVLEAMRNIERHRFVPANVQAKAYTDQPLPIGFSQTISQPYMVAYGCEALELGDSDQVLEVGTGSGYQAAVLGMIANRVVTIEIREPLYLRARRLLAELGFDRVVCRRGNGALGCLDDAPFDGIIVAAAATSIPETLVSQLTVGGVLIYPEGAPRGYQELIRVVRTKTGIERTSLMSVRFVPMVEQRPVRSQRRASKE